MKSDIIENFNSIFNELESELSDSLSKFEINKYLRPIELHKFFPSLDIVPISMKVSDTTFSTRGVSYVFKLFIVEQIQIPNYTQPSIEALDEVVNVIESMRDDNKKIMTYVDDLQISNINFSIEAIENIVIHITEVELTLEKSDL